MLAGWRTMIQSSSSITGRLTPCSRPVANSATTAGGTITFPVRVGRRCSSSNWWRYWRGEVLQTTSGKAGFLAQLFLRQPERVDPVVGKLTKEHHPGHACQAGRRAGRKPAQLEELDGRSLAQRVAC